MFGGFGLTEDTFTIPAGTQEVKFGVRALADSVPPENEAFAFNLASGAGYTLGASTGGIVTISDVAVVVVPPPPAAPVPPPPLLTVTQDAVEFFEPGGGVPEAATVFSFNLAEAPTEDLIINYSFSGAARRATLGSMGADFEAEFRPSESSMTTLVEGENTVRVTAGITNFILFATSLDDDTDDRNESFTFNVTPGVGYTLGTFTGGTVSIVDPAVIISPGDLFD